MRLELDGNGRLYIREITDDAWDYITKSRKLAGDPWEWYFSKEPYEGSVRVYYNSYNFADENLMGYLNELERFYEMKCGAPEKVLLESWRQICKIQKGFTDVNRERLNLEERARLLKRFLSTGCNRCGNFREGRDGDDCVGYCSQGSIYVPLDQSPLCLAHGGFGSDGTWHFGQKYYPHSGCKYLEIKGEKV